MKASTRYSLCASMPEEEEYMGRRHTPGAIKLGVDNTVMVTTGDAAEFFSQQQVIHKSDAKAAKCCIFGCGNF